MSSENFTASDALRELVFTYPLTVELQGKCWQTLADFVQDHRAWRPIETAPRDRTPILLKTKAVIEKAAFRPELASFQSIQFVGRHPGVASDGLDIGWGFAAPVGCGGIPDEWLEGWMPLPE